MSTPRQRARQRTEAEIRQLAWRHLEKEGAAALSLRAIARDLGIVSSAIYRYVPSRDDLLTLLIVEGYGDLADVAEQAERRVAADDYRGRWLSVAHAVRDFAVRRPAVWALLYGSPVPGYAAPADRTTEPGLRVVARLAAIVAAADAAGELRPPVGPARESVTIPTELLPGLAAAGIEVGIEAPPDRVALAIVGWTGLLGAVSAEIFGQLGPDGLGAPDALAEVTFGTLADLVGL